jgi:uncharacterized protein (TIGR03000 family)
MIRSAMLSTLTGVAVCCGAANAQSTPVSRSWSSPYFPIPAQDLAISGMIQTESGPAYIYGFYPNSRYYYGPELPKFYIVQGVTPDQVYPIAQGVLGYYRDAPSRIVSRAVEQTLPPPTAKTGRVQIVLPHADAEVWINDYRTTSRGMTRLIESPELEPEKTFQYTVRASWSANGKAQTEVRVVFLAAGRTSVADFTRPPEAERIPVPPPPQP